MRLLMFGHWSDTGFGIVTQELAERFLTAGLDVRVIAVNHRGEPVRGALQGRVWPATLGGAAYGGNLSHAAIDGTLWPQYDRYDEWQPDAVLVISDVSGLLDHAGPLGPTGPWETVPVFHYCPIEGDNVSIGWRGVWKTIQPVAMSDYGQRIISQHIDRPVPRIYHGVDTEVFRPVSAARPFELDDKVLRSKDDCKRHFGLDPNRKTLLRTDRYVERKFYYRLFEAFQLIAERDPDVDLLIHCRPTDEGGSLYEDIARLPPELHRRIGLTAAHDSWRGLTRPGLVALMNAADVYISTTGGEGFGLNLAESLACEVPVVVTDWAADKEVVGPGGFAVEPLIDRYGEPVRYHHAIYGMDWAVPDPKTFVEPTLELLSRKSRRVQYGQAGRAHVLANFSWDTAASEFLALFESSDIAEAA